MKPRLDKKWSLRPDESTCAGATAACQGKNHDSFT